MIWLVLSGIGLAILAFQKHLELAERELDEFYIAAGFTKKEIEERQARLLASIERLL